MLLKDKVLIITGVGPGMGRKMAVIGAAEGAKVALAARSKDYVQQVVDEVNAAGGDAIGVPTDVDNAEQCQALADATLAKWGRVDGLINSAYLHGAFATFEDTTIEEWQATMSVTCFGALRMVKAVLPAMKAAREGSIVNVSSMGSAQPYPGGAGYATAKAALEEQPGNWPRSLAPSTSASMPRAWGAWTARRGTTHGPIWLNRPARPWTNLRRRCAS